MTDSRFNPSEGDRLTLSIEQAMQDILRRISAGSAVAVVSTERGTDDRLYRGKFMPVDWNGYLECFQLPYTEGEKPLWDAGLLLELPAFAYPDLEGVSRSSEMGSFCLPTLSVRSAGRGMSRR